jgi:peptidoglycan-associated lipoprotein
MKLTRLVTPLLLGIALCTVGAGCRKTPVNVTELPGYHPEKVGDPNANDPLKHDNEVAGREGIPVTDPEIRKNWPRNKEMFAKDTVYFEYDQSTIKGSEKPKVANVAEYLKTNPATALEIDGHCDERGTDEYNRSLGERRALALREDLVKLGIDPYRIDTVSFGRNQPADTGHSDAAHAKNRRGEFLLETPPTTAVAK